MSVCGSFFLSTTQVACTPVNRLKQRNQSKNQLLINLLDSIAMRYLLNSKMSPNNQINIFYLTHS